MKQYLSLVLVFVIVGCNQAGAPGGELESREYAVQGCPVYDGEGQRLAEVPEEELEMYEFQDKMDDEERKTSTILRERRDTFDSFLESHGITRADFNALGSIVMVNTSLVVQLKEGLSKEKRKPIEEAIGKTREIYNQEAIIVEEVPVSRRGMEERIREVVPVLNGKEEIRKKVSNVGSCGGGIMAIEITLREGLNEEEMNVLRTSFDFPFYTKVSPGDASGYVTSIHQGEKLVDFTYFSDMPERVEVGDFVHITHGTVELSFPAQASAQETEVRETYQPEGAQMTDKEAVTLALEKVEEGPVKVTGVSFDDYAEEWRVGVTAGLAVEKKLRIITVVEE